MKYFLDALREKSAITGTKMNNCKHVKTVVNFVGEEEERPYTSLFCPDCKELVQQPGPTHPFRLRNR
jgi:hypothetical protein